MPTPSLSALLFLGLASVTLFHTRKETQGLLCLKHFPPLPDDQLPPLSLVVAARDEGETIGPALRSILGLDYPELEVILVNDRSSDDTADIARSIQEEHPHGDRLRLLDNRELPEGWLGKVHAQHLGVKAARHPLILLTDADVVFSPQALKRAVTAQQTLAADHIAVLPHLQTRGFWEPAIGLYLETLALTLLRPSSLHRSRYRCVGVGAFGLFPREVLKELGKLEPVRLQVIDDGFLGLMVKARGGRQFALSGQNELSLRWFSGLSGFLKGIEKNAYAAVGYGLPLALLVSLGVSTPFWGLLLLLVISPGWAAALYALICLVGLLVGRVRQAPVWSALTFPLASLAVATAFLRSAYLTERRQAVVWRDTSYSLPLLRKAQREFVKTEFARLRRTHIRTFGEDF